MEARACLNCPRPCVFRRALEDPVFARVLSDVVHLSFAPRESILYEGDPAHFVRCLASGYAKEFRSGRRGDDVVLRILGPGATLGLEAVLAEAPYAATIQTIGSVEVCTLPAETVREFIGASQDLSRELLASLARQIHLLQDDRIRRTENSVFKRTAHALLRLSTEPDGCVLPLRRTDLAQWIGTAPETLSRTLHGMERRGWIEVDRVRIVVRDRARLARAAGRS